MRSRAVVGVNAGVVLALGLALLVPLALSLLYRDGSWQSFLIPAALMISLGAAGMWASRLGGGGYVLERDVYLSVTLAWVLAALLGGVPFLIEGTFHSLLDSTFEAMSGFTTTGATLLSDIEAQATFLVALQEDLTLTSAATAVAATLNLIGSGLGQVGASENFEAVNSFGRVVLTGCMLLGRLEIFTALVLLSPALWKR